MKRNSSPKAKVLELASFCVPVGTPLEVRSTRIKGRFGGDFLVEVSDPRRVIARARHRNWRMAYKVLGVELSRLGVV
jgi:hypothetical protein